MKLHIILSALNIRLYGDSAFFSFLASEAERLSKSGNQEYCEFQTIELAEEAMSGNVEIDYQVFSTSEVMNKQSYTKLDPANFDCVFMVIEDADFGKHGRKE